MLLSMNLKRDVCIDSSVMGMGRGPGNLQTEVVMDFLNEKYGKTYQIEPVIDLYSRYIKKFYEESPWGYSIYHFISSKRALPQDFATYFKERDYTVEDFCKFADTLSASERIVYRQSFVEQRLKELNLLK